MNYEKWSLRENLGAWNYFGTIKEGCIDYVKKYVTFVSVEAMNSKVLKSSREKRVTLTDQIGVIGGTLSLITGMSILSLAEIICFVFGLAKKSLKKE